MVTVGQLMATKEIWPKLLPCRFPPALALKVAKFIQGVGDELQAADSTRVELVKAHGKQKEDGSGWIVEPDSEQWEAFAKELDELYRQEVGVKPFTMKLEDVLGQAKSGDLSPEECMLLDPFFGG